LEARSGKDTIVTVIATMSDVPTIDLQPYFEGTLDDRRRVAAQVSRACEEIGFFRIGAHGVATQDIDGTYDMARRFFMLPEEEKLLIRQPSPDVSRGYTPFRGETLSASLGETTPPDLKEMIDMGPVDVPGGEYYERPEAGQHFAANLWPEEPAGFRVTMEAYYRRLNRLANDLMALFALALELPEDFFFDKLDKNMSALRVICYPEQHEAPQPGQLRGGAHTDYGTLTILTSDNAAGGLQALHRDGHWVDIDPQPGTYIVNIGDVMQIWTNDRWVSTLHRVVNPAADKATTARRHSIVFFHQPNYDAVIDTLPTCVDPARRKYAPFTYGEHWMRKWMATKNY
jgi:isopenicillin N synthase-like dioxygenase